MELLGGSSTSDNSSRASSGSPSNSLSNLPQTPPNPFIADPTPNAYFNFLDDEFLKVDPLAPPPTVAAPFDFFGALVTDAALQSSSPESSGPSESTSPSFSASSASPVGINPQLMDTPVSKAMSDFDEDEEGDEDEGNELADIAEELEDADIVPVKVGGRGKAARKGTVQSGGIVKRSAGTPAPKDKKELSPTGMLSTTSVDPDDWRPTPEEYKKMSSKEKRQLRNKISARNFRVRRKEYITTLEGDIAERDRLIDHIRTELMGTKSENSALRSEIDALKKALLDGRGLPDTPVLPPPAPLPATSAAQAAIDAAKSSKSAPKSPLVVPNTRKDLPSSPMLAGRSFWAGASSGLGGFGGITPVHTTLIPEWGSILAGKVPSGTENTNAERRVPALQENLNPLLNGVNTTAVTGFGLGANAQKPFKDASLPFNVFDSFSDRNAFTLKSIDDFRMQLWTRMGQQQALNRQQQQLQQTNPTISGLASNIRPHFFQSNNLSSVLSGKSASSAYPTPPASPRLSSTSPSSTSTRSAQPTVEQQQAMLAAMASQTLVRKLGSAFWDAFSGSSSSAKKEWDADKVRKVLEGKAVVRVVDVEPTKPKTTPIVPLSEKANTSALKPKAVAASSSSSPASSSVSGCGPACTSIFSSPIKKDVVSANLLEEKLRKLQL